MKIGNLEVYGIIYKITNKINGKAYIGQTTDDRGFNGRYCFNGNGIERVYNYHLKNKQNNRTYNKHLLSSLEYYGLNNFEVIEIFDIAFSKEELNLKEQCWINIFNSFNNGYNNTLGGEGTKGIEGEKCYWYGKTLSEEHKQKLRSYRIGKKLTEETKIKIGLKNKGLKLGEKHPLYGKRGAMYGKHHSEKTKVKIGKANKGNKHTQDWCKQHSNDMKGSKNPQYRISPKERMDTSTYLSWLNKVTNISEETKLKMSRAKKDKPLSQAHKEKLSQANTQKKEIINLDTLEVFESMVKAANRYNLKPANISAVCRHIRKTIGGYHWMYYEDYIKQNQLNNAG